VLAAHLLRPLQPWGLEDSVVLPIRTAATRARVAIIAWQGPMEPEEMPGQQPAFSKMTRHGFIVKA
jgi:hypothetical protein